MVSNDFFKGQALRIAVGITMLVLVLASPGMVQAETGLPDKFQLPGQLEANGTHFELNNSEYLNITLISSEPVKLSLESIPRMVTMHLESISGAGSIQIILSGFAPQTTYHKYEDSYHNQVIFTTDDSGKYVYMQDLSKPHLIFIQPEISTSRAGTFISSSPSIPPGPYFINDNATGGDCTLIGIWDAATKTCILTNDLTDSIEMRSGEGITLDGNGHTIRGSNTGNGIFSFDNHHITIKNTKIIQFSNGIDFEMTHQNNEIREVILSNNSKGIKITDSGNILINKSTFSNNGIGIIADVGLQSDVNITNNDILNNGIWLEDCMGCIVIGNKINGNNTGSGITLASGGGNIAQNTISNYSAGIKFIRYYNGCSLNGNSIFNNEIGVEMAGEGGATLYNNTIFKNNIGFSANILAYNKVYNNNFNNSLNFEVNTYYLNSNQWNTTKTQGTNIIGGPYLGGNFWAYPNGTGFSQICLDVNHDGICDSTFVLDANSTDYLPLAAFSGPPGYGYISGTVLDNGIGIAGALVTTNTSVSTTTDASGSYSLLVVAGTYNLTATREPEYYRNSSVVVTAISGTIVAQDIELTRKPIGTISGKVTVT